MEMAISRLGRPWPGFVPRANKSLVWKWPFPGWGGPGPFVPRANKSLVWKWPFPGWGGPGPFVRLANKSLVWKWPFPGWGGPGPLSCLSLRRVEYGNNLFPAGAALARFCASRSREFRVEMATSCWGHPGLHILTNRGGSLIASLGPWPGPELARAGRWA